MYTCTFWPYRPYRLCNAKRLLLLLSSLYWPCTCPWDGWAIPTRFSGYALTSHHSDCYCVGSQARCIECRNVSIHGLHADACLLARPVRVAYTSIPAIVMHWVISGCVLFAYDTWEHTAIASMPDAKELREPIYEHINLNSISGASCKQRYIYRRYVYDVWNIKLHSHCKRKYVWNSRSSNMCCI